MGFCTSMYSNLRPIKGSHNTLTRKPESKNFDAQASVTHHQKRIASGFPGVCDFKSVCGAPGEIFHFEGFQILKLCLFSEGF